MADNPSDALYELLRPERLTAVVDIGANPRLTGPGAPDANLAHSSLPYKRLLDLGLCTVTGFEPQAEALAELLRRQGPRERYLPYAIGDGSEHTLHLCKARDMSSLFPLDPERLALFNEFPLLGQVDREIRVPTRRLDEIDEIQDIDFLKIDIQGAELEAFRSGQRKLAKAVAIQTEVSFITLYRGQPAIGEIDVCLRDMGFIPHCFADVKLWPIAPMIINGNPRQPAHQLLEADIVYVRDFSRPENLGAEQWKHLALIAHHCYGSVDLALRAILAVAKLGAIGPDAYSRYLAILRAQAGR